MLDRASNGVPFSEIDQAFAVGEDAFGPFTGDTTIETRMRLDLGRLHDAAARASELHFLCGMRRARSSVLCARDVWVRAETRVPDVELVRSAGTRAAHAAREAFLDELIPATRAPAFRILVSRGDDGDRLTFATSHIATDGVGAHCLFRSIAAEYAGQPADVGHVGYLEARRFLTSLAPSTPDARRERWREMGALAQDVLARGTTHVAPSAGARGTGGGIVDLAFPWSTASRSPDGPTVNDVLLVALLRAIEEHNVSRGVVCGRMSVLVPANLRPPDWTGPMGNFSIVGLVVSHPRDRLDPRSFLAAVTAQTRRLRADRVTTGMLSLMRAGTAFPIVAQDAFTRAGYASHPLIPTTILTNLGRVEMPRFGDTPSAPWLSPPCRSPCALGVATAFHEGRIHLGFRYRREVIARSDVETIARRMSVEATALAGFR
jgi:NRPS condensation-like uncharacterized protein